MAEMKKSGGNFSSEIRVKTPTGPSCREPGDAFPLAQAEDPELARLEDAIRDMPDFDPPDTFLSSVMDSVRTTRLSPWARFLRWAVSPRSITFTPLRAFSVAAALIAVTFALTDLALWPRGVSREMADERVPVVLVLDAPDARRVAVIGSFNGWRAQDLEPQIVDGEKRWALTLMLPAGRHEYAFVLDGERIVPDPGAGFHEEDGFGHQNAVLHIGNTNGSSI
ncbi:MAG: hypothetical protein GX443_10390 [Deltaproteobacteria bacterium]|nr:hypothetical protein [Deltaproteobacteria bacterium]